VRQLVQLARRYEILRDAGIEIWAISPEPLADSAALQERREFPFALLADSDQAVIRAWGLFNHEDPKGRSIPYPATFIVTADGRIAWRYVRRKTRDRPDAEAVIAAALSLGGRPEAG
jgi:peroxiredoxin